MAFRLPTHLESFIPPPSQQVPQSRPWRGTFVLHAPHFSNIISNQEISVTAAETDGDNRMELWPVHFYVHLLDDSVAWKDVQAWMKQHPVPLCTFMPDRLTDSSVNDANQATFRQLSRILFENQTVAIAPWGLPDRIPGAGIILYPTQTSTGMLVGAILLTSGFPDFILAALQSRNSSTARYTSQQYSASSLPTSSSTSGHALPNVSTSVRRSYRHTLSGQ